MFLRESECDVHVLDGLTGGTFAEVVDGRQHLHDAVALGDGDVGVVRALQRGQMRRAQVAEQLQEPNYKNGFLSYAIDKAGAQRLWQMTESMLGQTFEL